MKALYKKLYYRM